MQLDDCLARVCPAAAPPRLVPRLACGICLTSPSVCRGGHPQPLTRTDDERWSSASSMQLPQMAACSMLANATTLPTSPCVVAAGSLWRDTIAPLPRQRLPVCQQPVATAISCRSPTQATISYRMPPGITMSDDDLKIELERLGSENAALKRVAATGVTIKVGKHRYGLTLQDGASSGHAVQGAVAQAAGDGRRYSPLHCCPRGILEDERMTGSIRIAMCVAHFHRIHQLS